MSTHLHFDSLRHSVSNRKVPHNGNGMAKMYFRILVASFSLLSLCACDIHVNESVAPKAISTYLPCADIEKLKLAQAGPQLEDMLRKKDYQCFEKFFRTRPIAEIAADPDMRIISILVGLVTPSSPAMQEISAGLPNTTKLRVLSYLNLHTKAAKARGFYLEQFAGFIRTEARSSGSASRGEALSLLSNLMQEADIPLFVDAIESGDESTLVAGIYLLADRCSPGAIAALRVVSKHSAVTSYIKKYKETETISEQIRQKCPATL